MTDPCALSPDVHLNLNVRGLPPSATMAINERSARLRQEGREVFRFGLGQSPFPVPEPVVEELRKNAFQKDYLPVKGLPELRDAVAEHHRRTFGIACSPESVLVGPGSKELMFLLQLVYYGDLVVPTPAWVSYEPQARIIGRQVHRVRTRRRDDWRLTPERLDSLCATDPDRPRIVVLNDPSNPTGVAYGREHLAALAEVARRYRVVMLSDEIYGKLHHDGRHASIVPLYPEGTIFSGGLSKWCGAGGWRLGIFVVPACMQWLLDAMAAVASETFTSTCAPVQYAAVRAFQEDAEIEAYLAACRRLLKALGRHIVHLLRAAGIDVVTPAGGFYVFPRFAPHAEALRRAGITTDRALCTELLEETGVALLPGTDFGRAAKELTARLAYVDFDGVGALEAARSIPPDRPLDETFLEARCAPTLRGVRRLCEWFQEKLG